jgi:hypothetical protein
MQAGSVILSAIGSVLWSMLRSIQVKVFGSFLESTIVSKLERFLRACLRAYRDAGCKYRVNWKCKHS